MPLGLVTDQKGDSAAEKVARTHCCCLAPQRLMSSLLPSPQWGCWGVCRHITRAGWDPSKRETLSLGLPSLRKSPAAIRDNTEGRWHPLQGRVKCFTTAECTPRLFSSLAEETPDSRSFAESMTPSGFSYQYFSSVCLSSVDFPGPSSPPHPLQYFPSLSKCPRSL